MTRAENPSIYKSRLKLQPTRRRGRPQNNQKLDPVWTDPGSNGFRKTDHKGGVSEIEKMTILREKLTRKKGVK